MDFLLFSKSLSWVSDQWIWFILLFLDWELKLFSPPSASSDACLDGFAVRAIKVVINLCPNEWVCPWRLFIASWRRAVCHINSPPLGIDALKQPCISVSYFSKPESPRNPTLNGVYIPAWREGVYLYFRVGTLENVALCKELLEGRCIEIRDVFFSQAWNAVFKGVGLVHANPPLMTFHHHSHSACTVHIPVPC